MRVSQFLLSGTAALLLAFGISSCDKDNNPSTTGKVRFELTDAPVDDPNIEGVFVTVADVKVSGESIDGFMGKQTVDLTAYRNGQVKVVGEDNDLTAGTYNDVRLVLDLEKDASGVTPGCYVLMKDGTKHTLQTATNTALEVKASGPLDVSGDQTSAAVIDFDLRKALAYNTGNRPYKFVTDSELTASVQLKMRTETGTVKGALTDAFGGQAGSKIVVYAYKKGSFTANEKLPQGPSGIQFVNAACSAVADGEGNFTLAFLEKGDYELHFVGYDDANSDGKLEAKGFLLLDVFGGLDLTDLTVNSGATVQLNLTIIGLLPL